MTTAASSTRRVLVCAPLPPEYDRESGSRRIYHLIEFFLEAGWTVCFVCENAPDDSRHVAHLRQRGVLTHVGFDGQAADLIAAGGFQVAIFAFWYLADRYADLVRRLSPETRIVVETVDLHWLRNARRLLGAANGGAGRLDAAYGSELVDELNAYAGADGVLTVSAKEAGLVNDIAGDPGLAHPVPDSDDVPPSELSFEERRGVLFVGNFRHPPNVDAVAYLCRDILPLVPSSLLREHPLTIVGNGLDGRVREVAEELEHVRLVGWVPSLVPYLHRARLSVIPLRYGAGTKRKLMQALLARTPSVATPVGVEGMDVRDGEHLLVASDAEAFARAVERVIGDRELWEALASKGRRRMLRAHGHRASRARLQEAVGRILDRPAKARLAWRDVGNDLPASRVLHGVQEAVAAALPETASVLVVSKGDPELVRLPKRTGRHFPQSEDGRWAGYHPRDSRDAIEHLERLRPLADYLLVPAPSFWWMEYYRGFASHLDEAHERVWSDETCLIYRLGRNGGTPGREVASSAGAPGRRRQGARSGDRLRPNHRTGRTDRLGRGVTR